MIFPQPVAFGDVGFLAFGCSSSPEIDFSCLPIVPPALPGCICATATAGAKSTLTAKMSEQTKYIGLPKKPNRTKGRLQRGEEIPGRIDVQQLVSSADPMHGRAATHTLLPRRVANDRFAESACGPSDGCGWAQIRFFSRRASSIRLGAVPLTTHFRVAGNVAPSLQNGEVPQLTIEIESLFPSPDIFICSTAPRSHLAMTIPPEQVQLLVCPVLLLPDPSDLNTV